MWRVIISSIVFLVSFFGLISSANAYIGPGLGLGTVGILIGLLGSIILALIAVLWYPFKRLLKKIKKKKDLEPEEDRNESAENSDPS